jgi:hypothetical protein
MNFLKIKLLVVAIVMFAASSAFASFSYNVSVDTTGLSGSFGYLYFQYTTGINQVGTTTATVQNFSTDGVLGAQADGAYANSGTYVTGTLPGSVSFGNGTVGTNDYNHAITFGTNLNFNLLLPAGDSNVDGSTFSFWLAQDALGMTPLKTDTGMLFSIGLNANDTTTTVVTDAGTIVTDAGTNVTPTPIPAAAWLLGSGLLGLVGMRRKKQLD